ncbi:hypothetical protein BGW36DRAFT_428657 [Talaromyces proteolyticus]|uniref:Urease accessory protein UreD n=1 Tax=Talaromyces proteolyticus TaxID=1131652 RepID=A0AAD4KRL7_9EURO|nr:uncharacterized protein BGW36DRAFT_428657 [Talaromyces proteolyticus]KAH8696662.1 hypothetical protein BGW36DRAFT_428657 [Talaromyces proteolyticus]
MPHKHRRRQKDESTYDLPPTTIAKPLSVHKAKPQNGGTKSGVKKTGTKPKAETSKWGDDTPRAFARLMQYQKLGKMPSGLDDGNNQPRGKKRKHEDEKNESSSKIHNATDTKSSGKELALKILPGEKLSDFAARVDQEMPLSAMKRSQRTAQSQGMPKIREERITKHEKHLRKLQKGWREEEARIREKEAEARELREAENEDLNELWKEWRVEAGKGKAKKKTSSASKKKRRGKGESADGNEDDDDDDDPWAKLNTRERAARPLNPLEVVQAPPESLAKPREIFRVRRGVGGAEVDIANVPVAAGSLRRREELAKERKSIVEEYRRLMAEKRG